MDVWMTRVSGQARTYSEIDGCNHLPEPRSLTVAARHDARYAVTSLGGLSWKANTNKHVARTHSPEA